MFALYFDLVMIMILIVYVYVSVYNNGNRCEFTYAYVRVRTTVHMCCQNTCTYVLSPAVGLTPPPCR